MCFILNYCLFHCMRTFLIGYVCILFVDFLWVSSGFTLQEIYENRVNYDKPLAVALFQNSTAIVMLIPYVIRRSSGKKIETDLIPFRTLLSFSLPFACIWILSQWLYNWSLSHTAYGVNAALSSTSSIWTYVCSAFLLKEKARILTMLFVTIAMGGVAVCGFYAPTSQGKAHPQTPEGILSCLSAAVFYALYTVTIKMSQNQSSGDISISGNSVWLEVSNGDISRPSDCLDNLETASQSARHMAQFGNNNNNNLYSYNINNQNYFLRQQLQNVTPSLKNNFKNMNPPSQTPLPPILTQHSQQNHQSSLLSPDQINTQGFATSPKASNSLLTTLFAVPNAHHHNDNINNVVNKKFPDDGSITPNSIRQIRFSKDAISNSPFLNNNNNNNNNTFDLSPRTLSSTSIIPPQTPFSPPVASLLPVPLSAAFIARIVEEDTLTFLGIIGLEILMLCPLFLFLADQLHVEVFEQPPPTTILLIISVGLFGSVVSEFFLAKAVIFLNPVLATVGMSLQTPLSVIVDAYVLRKNIYPAQSWFGAAVIFIGVVALSVDQIVAGSLKGDRDGGGKQPIDKEEDENDCCDLSTRGSALRQPLLTPQSQQPLQFALLFDPILHLEDKGTVTNTNNDDDNNNNKARRKSGLIGQLSAFAKPSDLSSEKTQQNDLNIDKDGYYRFVKKRDVKHVMMHGNNNSNNPLRNLIESSSSHLSTPVSPINLASPSAMPSSSPLPQISFPTSHHFLPRSTYNTNNLKSVASPISFISSPSSTPLVNPQTSHSILSMLSKMSSATSNNQHHHPQGFSLLPDAAITDASGYMTTPNMNNDSLNVDANSTSHPTRVGGGGGGDGNSSMIIQEGKECSDEDDDKKNLIQSGSFCHPVSVSNDYMVFVKASNEQRRLNTKMKLNDIKNQLIQQKQQDSDFNQSNIHTPDHLSSSNLMSTPSNKLRNNEEVDGFEENQIVKKQIKKNDDFEELLNELPQHHLSNIKQARAGQDPVDHISSSSNHHKHHRHHHTHHNKEHEKQSLSLSESICTSSNRRSSSNFSSARLTVSHSPSSLTSQKLKSSVSHKASKVNNEVREDMKKKRNQEEEFFQRLETKVKKMHKHSKDVLKEEEAEIKKKFQIANQDQMIDENVNGDDSFSEKLRILGVDDVLEDERRWAFENDLKNNGSSDADESASSSLPSPLL